MRAILKDYPRAIVGVSENRNAKQILLRCEPMLQIDDALQQWCEENGAKVVDDVAVEVRSPRNKRRKETMRELTINYQ